MEEKLKNFFRYAPILFVSGMKLFHTNLCLAVYCNLQGIVSSNIYLTHNNAYSPHGSFVKVLNVDRRGP